MKGLIFLVEVWTVVHVALNTTSCQPFTQSSQSHRRQTERQLGCVSRVKVRATATVLPYGTIIITLEGEIMTFQEHCCNYNYLISNIYRTSSRMTYTKNENASKYSNFYISLYFVFTYIYINLNNILTYREIYTILIQSMSCNIMIQNNYQYWHLLCYCLQKRSKQVTRRRRIKIVRRPRWQEASVYQHYTGELKAMYSHPTPLNTQRRGTV